MPDSWPRAGSAAKRWVLCSSVSKIALTVRVVEAVVWIRLTALSTTSRAKFWATFCCSEVSRVYANPADAATSTTLLSYWALRLALTFRSVLTTSSASRLTSNRSVEAVSRVDSDVLVLVDVYVCSVFSRRRCRRV